ncbi:MAG: hypothetical protein KU37_06140 [Sulfuricurvum sp. PC08-66]|nr:MAG: hypothetical protein KU37_06140 [Sulfuricurvum sp. PC08-66]
MQLLETLLCIDGVAQHLPYHQARLARSYHALFGGDVPFVLERLITPPPQGRYRCRLLYDAHQTHIEYIPYTLRTSRRLGIVHTTLEYPYKFAHREPLDSLKKSIEGVDDVILLRDGLISDTTIANIACLIDGVWLTPATPLLAGTTRARLLDEGFLQCGDITLSMLENADSIALMNALTGFYVVHDPILQRP